MGCCGPHNNTKTMENDNEIHEERKKTSWKTVLGVLILIVLLIIGLGGLTIY